MFDSGMKDASWEIRRACSAATRLGAGRGARSDGAGRLLRPLQMAAAQARRRALLRRSAGRTSPQKLKLALLTAHALSPSGQADASDEHKLHEVWS